MGLAAKESLLPLLDAHTDAVLARQVTLLQALIGCRTISAPTATVAFTREAERAITLVESALAHLGFICERWLTEDGFPTLSASRDNGANDRVLGFNGHLDVVPIEDPAK